MNSRIPRFLIVTIVLASLAYLGIIRYRRHVASRPAMVAIRFTPEEFKFGDSPVFTGDRIRFDAAIENKSPTAVIITEIPKTCGCMTFGDEGGLKLPATLPPGGRFSFHVEIGTEGKTGSQTMQLSALATTTSGEPVPDASLTIRGQIRSSTLALPESIYAEVRRDEAGAPLVRTVVLADEWPGEGLTVARIESTAGERMTFHSAPVGGRAMVRGLDLTRRAELTIRYQIPPGAEAFDETITVTPALAAAKPLAIRLHGKVLPDYEFRPASLVCHTRPGVAASRVLEYRYSAPRFRDVAPVASIAGVTIEELDGSADSRRFRVTFPPAAGPGTIAHELAFRVGDGGALARVSATVFLTAP